MTIARLLQALVALAAVTAGPALAQAPPAPPPGQLSAPQTSQAPFDVQEGIRLHNDLKYAEALPVLDRAIGALNPNDAAERELLIRAFEYRARSRYTLSDTVGASADFEAILRLRPEYQPDAGMSPRVRGAFSEVRARVVGDVMLQLVPPGEVMVDGRPFTVTAEALSLALLAGDHAVSAKRTGYSTIDQRFTVAPGVASTVTLTLERSSATLSLRTLPVGVDVLVNGAPKGTTVAPSVARPDTSSAPLLITDLAKGNYVVRLQRDCFKALERTVVVREFDDMELADPLRLEPAVAKLTLHVSEPGYTIYLDAKAHGTTEADLATVCEGEHVIEVRSARGRYIDKRYWRQDDVETLNAVLRPAFAIVVNTPPAGIKPVEFTQLVERALAAAKGALIFTPADEELESALKADNVTGDLFHGTAATTVLRRREIGERLSKRLGVQGIAAIESTGSPDSIRLSLLAVGSASPEVLSLDLNSAASRAAAAAALTAEIPPLERISVDALLIDVAGVQGGVVIRPGAGGAAQKAGLAAGDVITAVGAKAVASAGQVYAQLSGKQDESVTITVRSIAGVTRQATLVPHLEPDTIPMADRHLLYNGLLLRLQDMLQEAKSQGTATAVRLNLAIVEMRLGRWPEAARNLEQLKLPEGRGVSAGTIAYLTGVCYEALGRTAESNAAFTAAAKSPDSMLSLRGPRTAPLAQEKLASR